MICYFGTWGFVWWVSIFKISFYRINNSITIYYFITYTILVEEKFLTDLIWKNWLWNKFSGDTLNPFAFVNSPQRFFCFNIFFSLLISSFDTIVFFLLFIFLFQFEIGAVIVTAIPVKRNVGKLKSNILHEQKVSFVHLVFIIDDKKCNDFKIGCEKHKF